MKPKEPATKDELSEGRRLRMSTAGAISEGGGVPQCYLRFTTYEKLMKSTFDVHAFDLASKRIIDASPSPCESPIPDTAWISNTQRRRAGGGGQGVGVIDHSSSDLNTQPSILNTSPEPQHSAPSTQPLLTLPGRVSTFFTFYKGRKLGPYYVRRWKEHGKPKKQYVKPKDLERIKEACARHRFKRNEISKNLHHATNIGKNITFLLAMHRRAKNGALRVLDILHIDRIEKNGMATPGCPPLRSKWVFMAPLFANLMKNSIYGLEERENSPNLDPDLWMKDGKPTKPLNVSYLRFTPQGQFAQ